MRVLQMDFGYILSTFTTLTHALYHIAAASQYADILRQEIKSIVQEEGWTKLAMQCMQKVDSFLREFARMNPLGMITMHHAAQDYTFSNGVVVRKGETVASAMDAVHQNAEEDENPGEFRP